MMRLARSDVGVAVGWVSMQKSKRERIGEVVKSGGADCWVAFRGKYASGAGRYLNL